MEGTSGQHCEGNLCTYGPLGVRICFNGHKWLIQLLRLRGHHVEPLDNDIAAVDDPVARTALHRCFVAHIQRFFDRWMHRLPNPLHGQRSSLGLHVSTFQIDLSYHLLEELRAMERAYSA